MNCHDNKRESMSTWDSVEVRDEAEVDDEPSRSTAKVTILNDSAVETYSYCYNYL